MRPLWALRYLVRFGCNITVSLVLSRCALRFATPGRAAAFLRLQRPVLLRHRIVFHDLAFEDPHLHADDAISGAAQRGAIVNVGAERMQRHATLAVPFHARDFGAAEPATAIDADASRAHAHRRLHGALHGAAERDA